MLFAACHRRLDCCYVSAPPPFCFSSSLPPLALAHVLTLALACAVVPVAGSKGFGRSPCTIYVGNLHADVTEEVLYELFLQAGPVDDVHIPPPKAAQGPASSFGFVEMSDVDGLQYACALLNGLTLRGKALRVQPAGGDAKVGGSSGGSGGGQVPPDHATTTVPTRVHTVAPQRYTQTLGGAQTPAAVAPRDASVPQGLSPSQGPGGTPPTHPQRIGGHHLAPPNMGGAPSGAPYRPGPPYPVPPHPDQRYVQQGPPLPDQRYMRQGHPLLDQRYVQQGPPLPDQRYLQQAPPHLGQRYVQSPRAIPSPQGRYIGAPHLPPQPPQSNGSGW